MREGITFHVSRITQSPNDPTIVMVRAMRRKNMIQCRDVDRLLEAFLDEGLAGGQQTAVTHHLQTCPHCQQLVAAERQRLHQFTRLGERPQRLSPAESARLRTAVIGRVRRRTMLREGFRFLRSGAGLALVCVAVLAGLLWWQRENAVVETSIDPGDVTTITFAAFESQRGSYERRMAEFNAEYPRVRVQFVPLDDVPVIDDGARYDRRAIASLADTAVLLPPTNAAEAGFFLDLEPLIAADPAFNTADFWPGALDGCRRGNRLIGVPTQISFNYLFYDGAAFDAAGLPHPQPGWTWSEFATAAAALTERNGDRTTRYGFVPYAGAGSLLSSLTDPLLPGAEGALNIDQLVGATDWYVQLTEAGAIPTFADSDEPWQAADELIELGEAAMWVDFQGNLARWQQTLGETVGAAPFPVNEANTATTPATAGCVAASVGTAHPQEAWLWLSYLTRNPVSGSTRTIPARQSVAQAIPIWQEELNAPNSTLAYAVAHAWYGQNNPEGLDVVVGAIEDAAVSDTDLDAAIAAIGTLPPQPTAAPLDAPIVVATPFPTLTPAAESDKTIIAFAPTHLLGVEDSDRQVYVRAYEEQHPDIEILSPYEPLLEEAGNLRGMDAWARFFAHYYDCFAWQSVALAEHPSELFYSLEPFLAADETGLRDDFHPGLLDSLRVDGELYMLPLTVSPPALIYNATQFSLLGLPEPTADMSVDELLALAQTAVATDQNGELVGWTPLGEEMVFYLLQSRGAVPYNLSANPPQANFDHPDMVSGVNWLLEQSAAGALYFPYADAPGSGPRWRAVDQRHALLWSGYGSLLTSSVENTQFRLGIMPLPTVAQYQPPVSTSGMYISRRAADPQACWDWMVFLSENLEYGNNLPARTSIMASTEWETAVGPEQAEPYREIAARSFPPSIGGETDVRVRVLVFWLGQALKAAQEGTDVATALAEAQRQAETYLACMAETPGAGVIESQQCQEQLETSWLAPPPKSS